MSWTNNKIELHKEMENTYLIQRLHQPHKFDNPFSFGGGLRNGGLSEDAMNMTRSIWSYDYMGASEFEWGIVPATIRFLAEQASQNKLSFGELALGVNQSVYYIAPSSYANEVINRIKLLREDKIRTMEHVGLRNYFDDTNPYAKQNVGWMEVDNGFMFFTDKPMFEKTCKLFGLK